MRRKFLFGFDLQCGIALFKCQRVDFGGSTTENLKVYYSAYGTYHADVNLLLTFFLARSLYFIRVVAIK